MDDLPANWEAFKAFLMQDSVAAPNKPLLPFLFEVYEAGWKRTFPPQWIPFVELHRLRQIEGYAEIIEAEERYGRYTHKRVAEQSPAKKQKTKTKK